MGGINPMEKEIEYLNKIIEKKPVYKDILTFYQKILKEQRKIKIEEKDISYELDSEEIIKEKLRKGFPLLDRKKIKINFKPAEELAERLIFLFKAKIEIPISELLKKIFFAEDVSNLGNEEKERYLILISKLSLQPLTKAITEKFKKYLDQRGDYLKLWLNGYCPICGSKPNIAEIKGDYGEKYLHCSFCGYEWLHKRLVCPYCGNTDHQTLGYFYTENEEQYRIDVCEKCKHYIKTVDSRKLSEPVNLEIEDWCTIHLDFIATSKGYQKEKSTLLTLWYHNGDTVIPLL